MINPKKTGPSYRQFLPRDGIIDAIFSFRNLPNKWHYGEGRGATKAAIGVALEAYGTFVRKGIRRVEVFPDVNGGILLCGYYEEETIEVLCSPNGSVGLLHEVDDAVILDEDQMTVTAVAEYVKELPWSLRRPSDSYTQATIVGKKVDLPVWRSAPPRTMVVSQSSMRNAQGIPAALNASILAHITTPEYLENPQYSGGFTPKNYRAIGASNTNHPLRAIHAT